MQYLEGVAAKLTRTQTILDDWQPLIEYIEEGVL